MTPKQAAENLGKVVTFNKNPYKIAAIIKRLTDKGIIWQVELIPINYRNGIVIARAEDIS